MRKMFAHRRVWCMVALDSLMFCWLAFLLLTATYAFMYAALFFVPNSPTEDVPTLLSWVLTLIVCCLSVCVAIACAHGLMLLHRRFLSCKRLAQNRLCREPQYRYDGVDENGQHWLEELRDGEPTERYVPVRLYEYEDNS